jgi:DNA polymerase-1
VSLPLFTLFKDFEMTSWNMIPVAEWVETQEQVADMSRYLENSGEENGVAVDTETTGLNISKDFPLMLSLSDGKRRFAMMANPWLQHPGIKDGLLGNRRIPKIGTNLKFDLHMLGNAGIQVVGELRDTLTMSWLHNENRFAHGLKDTAKDYCGLRMLEFKEIFPMRKASKNTPAETPGEAIQRVLTDPEGRKKAIEYSGLDAFASWRVHDYLKWRLKDESIRHGYSLWDHFINWESPFTRVLWNMERRGITICTGHLRAQQGPMEREMLEIEGKIAEMAGWVININSVHQLRKLFFEQLKYQPVKWSDGGKSGIKSPSTDEEVLDIFASNGCKFSKLIRDHRKISKIYGTYIEGLLGWVDPELRIHTTLKQGGAVTGRLASADPNIQNIPRSKTDKYKIRDAFVASPGKRLVVADYDQLEMKLMAHFSGDQRMCEAINTGRDLHCVTVSLMFAEDYDAVIAAKKAKSPTPEQEILVQKRQSAKAVGFGLIYGIGPQKLAGQLTDELKREVTKEEAALNIKKYFGAFPGVEDFIKATHRYCHQTEFVQTILGRKRRLPQINAKGGGGQTGDDAKGIVAEARRQSVNSIIQGTASDVAKAAMLRAENDEVLRSYGAELLLQIHDELIFEVDDNPQVVEAVKNRVKELMEDPFNGYKLNVPLTTEAHSGYTWTEAK